MLEKGGHARRNWDFIRRHEIAVPEEIKDWVETADKAGLEDLATLREPTKTGVLELPGVTLEATGIIVGSQGEAFQAVNMPRFGLSGRYAALPRFVKSDGSEFEHDESWNESLPTLLGVKKSKKRRKKHAETI